MIKLFTENRGIAALLLPLIVVGYMLMYTYYPKNGANIELYYGFFGTFSFSNNNYLSIIAGCFLLLNGALINFVFNTHNFFEKITYLPALIYIVWMSFYNEMFIPSGLMLAHTFFILGIHQLFFLNQNEDGRRRVFNAALFFGLSASLQPIVLAVFIFIFFSVWVFRPFVLRESMLIITGFVIPFLYAIVALKFQNKSLWDDWEFTFIDWKNLTTPAFIFAGLIVVFFTFSRWGLSRQLHNCSIRFRKQITVLRILFFVAICMGAINFFTQNTMPFSFAFIILAFTSYYAFHFKPVAIFMNYFFALVFVLSIARFFISTVFW